MSEIVSVGYKRLFEVRILHHYWLDDGATVFDDIAEPLRTQRLLRYDLRPIISIAPTALTAQKLSGLGCLFKTTPLGFLVAVKGNVSIPNDAFLDFTVTVRDPAFYNYTAFTLRKQQITEHYHRQLDKTCRYKANTFTFSNETGTVKTKNNVSALYLSKPVPAPTLADQAEWLVDVSGKIFQLVGDQSVTQMLPAVTADFVYANQADIPVINPPAGLTGAPERGIELTDDLPDDLFALIRIVTLLPNNKLGLYKDGPTVNDPKELREPVFQIRLKNRLTRWVYRRIGAGTPTPASTTPLPLTFYGNAGTDPQKLKPSSGMVKIVFASNDPAKIKETFSEIFE